MFRRIKTTLILVAIVCIFLLSRGFSLTRDVVNSDELRWHLRSNNFLAALKNRELEQTYQHYQPGVTLMWIDATVLQVFKTYPYIKHADYFPNIHAYAKLGILVVLTANFILHMSLLAKLKTPSFAALFGFVIATEPYLIGIDRWVHLTSLETYFSFSAVLLICLWVKDTAKYILPILSGAFLGLAVLSKLTSLIFLPVLLGILLFAKKAFVPASTAKWYLSDPFPFKEYKSVVHFLFTFFSTFIILFPALWVNHQVVLVKLIQSITNAVDGDVLGTYYTGWNSALFYLKILAFKLSPVTLLTLFFALYFFITKRAYKLLDVTSVSFFVAIYILCLLTVSDKKIDRYVILVLPYLAVLVAFAVDTFKSFGKTIFACAQMALLIYVFYIHYPVMSGYYSPAFGGTHGALREGVYDNSGEYLLQAADYLNANGRPRVYVPFNIDTFKPMYKGFSTDNSQEKFEYVINTLDFDRKELPACKCKSTFFGPRDISVVGVSTCVTCAY